MEAERLFKVASTFEEKMDALKQMLRSIPKHKGTEKMQADIKRRIGRLRKESQKKKSTFSQKSFDYVPREGAGQVVLCGPPNAGKSQLLVTLTHANAQVADYPFTTRLPQPGMMAYEDIQIQLVDSPPLSPRSMEAWQTVLIRNSDVALVIVDVTDSDLLEQTEFLLDYFQEKEISLSRGRPHLLFLGNKVDRVQGKENWQAWQELYQDRFQSSPICALVRDSLEDLRSAIFRLLAIIRVYTKAPGQRQESNGVPYVLKQGSTILDAASTIHKDLGQGFKFARVWRKTCLQGQMVERTHILKDRDLVEIHT